MIAVRSIFISLLFPLVLSGEDVGNVSVALISPNANVPKATLDLRPVNAEVSTRRVTFDCCATKISVPTGQWFFHVAAVGYWSETRLVSIGDDPVDIPLMLFRATKVSGKVATGDAVTVYFHPVEPNENRVPESSVACPVIGGSFECDVPIGKHDLAFRRPGHASLYRWAVDLRDAPFDVGLLQFRKGSTLSGRVEFADGRRQVMRHINITVSPTEAAARNDALQKRADNAKLVTHPNERGFFSFNLDPGEYALSASWGDLASERRELTIVDGHESLLRAPLRLEQRRSLAIRVHPPTDPWKKPWRATLRRLDSPDLPSVAVRVPVDGVCTLGKRSPGTYEVEIGRGDEEVWARSEVVLDSDLASDVFVTLTKVRGTVRLGTEPLAGQLTFRAAEGLFVSARSQADGTFFIWLPTLAKNKWEWVDIESTTPVVSTTLADQILWVNQDGNARLDLQLPSNLIKGRVVDENGELVAPALVSFAVGESFRQLESADGTFEVHGLRAGKTLITAASKTAETVTPLAIEVGDRDFIRDIELVVGSVSRLRGVVRSNHGPVIGAGIFAQPSNQSSPVIGLMPVSPEGGFDLRFPPRTRDVILSVAAPGFAFRFMRLAIPPDGSPTDIAVDQHGGKLQVEFDTVRADAPAPPPYLIHNGAILPLNVAAYLAKGRLSETARGTTRLEVDPMEEGAYTLCFLTDAELLAVQNGSLPLGLNCSSGQLPRHGVLSLRGVTPSSQTSRTTLPQP